MSCSITLAGLSICTFLGPQSGPFWEIRVRFALFQSSEISVRGQNLSKIVESDHPDVSILLRHLTRSSGLENIHLYTSSLSWSWSTCGDSSLLQVFLLVSETAEGKSYQEKSRKMWQFFPSFFCIICHKIPCPIQQQTHIFPDLPSRRSPFC